MFNVGSNRQHISRLTRISDEKESLNDNTHITLRGIQNLGNTCYFNAILQALAASRSFQMYLDELVTSAPCRLPAVTTALKRCMQELQPGNENTPKPLIPSELNQQLALRIGNFGRRKQQDSQEILHLLLHLIQREQATELYPDRGLRDIAAFLRGDSVGNGELSSSRGSTGYGSLLPALFSLEGSISYEQFRQTVETCERWMPLCGLEGNFLQCTSCKMNRPVSNHRFTSISLALGTSSKVEKITLDACLRYYTREELISDVECVRCSIRQAIESTCLQYASLTTQLEAEGGWESNTASPHSMEVEIKVHDCRNRMHTLQQLLESSNLHQIDLQNVITPAERIVSNCTKSMRFTRCPETFCFHFNRKVYFDWSGTTSKLDTHVVFPIEIDMRPFCFFGEANLPVNSSVDRAHYLYEIVAVISHHGDEHSGHYIAYRRVKISDAHAYQWFWASDDVVHRVEIDQVRSSRAYLLFYERKESESTRVNGNYGSSRSSLREAGSFAWSRKGISGSQMDDLETVEATDFEMTVERDLKLSAHPDNLSWAR
uniref:ubiquitinyl hydrolase 1 n=1 Tax=Albugo laibachii Nc14 TaxID=890382 RepID=F0WS33_9STRA|nr:ubiquitinspecific protease putative [Albugo laibachii Nc14]|eukprot:CCA24151.1 ubiquitinspecific protease putative [Albugo laibachii Nc14]